MWPNMLCPRWLHIERVLCCNCVFPPHAHFFNRKSESRSIVSDSLRPHGVYGPWNSPGQITGVGSLSLLQGIFPTQVSHIAGRFFTSWATYVKNLPAMQQMQETRVRDLGRENPLEEGMATHSRILAWRIPWTEEPVRIQSTGSQRVRHHWNRWAHYVYPPGFQLLNFCSPCSIFIVKVQQKDSMVEAYIYLCMQNKFFFKFWNWLLGSYHNFDLYMPYDNIEQSYYGVLTTRAV